jgi:hypothetical protein
MAGQCFQLRRAIQARKNAVGYFAQKLAWDMVP